MMTMHRDAIGEASLNTLIRFCIKPELFVEEPILVEAMSDVEHIYKIEGLAFYSSDFGVKSPESLSNGMKALILLVCYAKGYHNEIISNCCIADNSVKYLQLLSMKYDFDIAWDIYISPDFDTPVNAVDAETGDTYTTGKELLYYY